MQYITNSVFSDREKQYLDFVLRHAFPERNIVAGQLNEMKAAGEVRIHTRI